VQDSQFVNVMLSMSLKGMRCLGMGLLFLQISQGIAQPNPIQENSPKAGQTDEPTGIYFKTGSIEILPESYPMLDHYAKMFELNPRWVVEVRADTFCKEPPSPCSFAYMDSLSRRRANAIILYMVDKGCLKENLLMKGWPENPQAAYPGNHLNRFKILQIRPERDVYPIDSLHPKVGQFAVFPNLVYYDNRIFMRDDSLYNIVKNHSNWLIEIGVYSDCRASARYNDSLSLARAMGVKEILIEKGCVGSNLIAKGYGEHYLLNNCWCEPNNFGPGKDCTEAEHAINRRTEIKIIGFVGGDK